MSDGRYTVDWDKILEDWKLREEDKQFNLELEETDSVTPPPSTPPSYNQSVMWPSWPTSGTVTTTSTSGSSSVYPYTYTNSGTGGLLGSLSTDFSNMAPKGFHVISDAEFDGDVKIKGKSLTDTLDKIEQRLAILRPNTELEERWEKLKELGDAYRELEKDIIEKEKIWDTLKK